MKVPRIRGSANSRNVKKVQVMALARWLCGLRIIATMAADVARGLGHGPIGAAVGLWAAVALAGSSGFLMIIRGGWLSGDAAGL